MGETDRLKEMWACLSRSDWPVQCFDGGISMPSTVSEDRFDNPTVEATVYRNERLDLDLGSVPEEKAIEVLTAAFEAANLNYEITHGLPVQGDLPPSDGGCDDTFDVWNDRVIAEDIPEIAKDTNVLLTNAGAGGCSNNPSRDPNRCTAGAGNFDSSFSYQLDGAPDTDSSYRSAHALLHEVGHNLGFVHKPHGGYAFNADGYWHRTPTVGGNNMDNMCGTRIESRTNVSPHFHLFYHWCAVTEMEIVGEDYASVPVPYPPRRGGQTTRYADRFDLPPATTQCEITDVSVSTAPQSVTMDYTVTNHTVRPLDAVVQVDMPDESYQEQVTVGARSLETRTANASLSNEQAVETEVCASVDDASYAE